MKQTLSVAVITHNEAENIARTLASVAWADELVVIDSGSTDRTVDIARACGANVVVEEWRGFAAQKNFAISQCNSEWILSLDADEEVSPALAEEIQATLKQPIADGYYVRRANYFLGKVIQHGGYYPDEKLRLFRRGRAEYAARSVHETMRTSGRTAALRGDLLHYAYPTLEGYLEHMNRYSSLSADNLAANGKRVILIWHVLAMPFATFLYNYFVRFGFLDGRRGFLLHLYHSVYVSWKYAKAWELTHRA